MKPRAALLVAWMSVCGFLLPMLAGRSVRAEDPVAAPTASATPQGSLGRRPPRPPAHEVDPYSRHWHESVMRCERFAMDPIVRMMQGAPTRDPSEDAGDHAGIFHKTAAALRARPKGAIEFVIATVPDPLQSGMFYSTDRVLEALQRGIEAPGASSSRTRWLRDRYWSPWIDDQGLVEDGDKTLMIECQRRMPGVLTFRDDRTFGLPPTGGRPQAMVVFLVGESPIFGINKSAIREALDFIALAAPENEELKIIGPTYSGSASSLWLALSSWKRPSPAKGSLAAPRGGKKSEPAMPAAAVPCFTIVSGTVTREVTKERLSTCPESAGATSCLDACKGVDGPKIAFHTTTIPDRARLEAFYAFLEHDLEVPASRDGGRCTLTNVALIKETSTAYSLLPASGGDAGGPPQDVRPDSATTDAGSPDARAAPSRPADGTTGEGDAPDEEEDLAPAPLARGRVEYAGAADGVGCTPALEMSFPPHISNVRRAYDAQRRATARTAGSADLGLLPALTPSLDEPGEPKDVFPNLSKRTVFSNDLVIDNIIDTLGHHDIRYVGLFATDRSDVIFLASQLHHNASDMRLFTFSSELLYAHPAYEPSLNGMLVASTYPLTVDHDIVAGRVDLFSGEQEEGIFNATVAILGKRDAMRDYTRDPGREALPPVWISVIGRGGAFPLKRITDFEDSGGTMVRGDSSVPSRQTFAAQPVPHLWRLTFFVVSLVLAYVATVHAYALILFAARSPRWRRAFARAGLRRADEVTSLRDPPVESVAARRDNLHIVPSFPPLASLFYPCIHPRLRLRKDAFTTGLFAFILAAYAPLDALHAGSTGSSLGTVVTIALAVSLGVSIVLLLVHIGRGHWRDGIGRTDFVMDVTIVVSALLVASFAMFIAGHIAAHVPPSCEASPFCRRAVVLDSGVSPITPLLLAIAIILLWTVGTIDRLRMADGLSMLGGKTGPDGSPYPPIAQVLAIGVEADAPQDVATLEQNLRDAVMAPSRTLGVRLVLCPLAAIPAYALIRIKPFSTLETHLGESVFSANALAAAIVALCTFLLADTIVSILVVYVRLRALLRRLARHSLADAYGRLSGGLARSLEQQLSGAVPDLTELAIPVLQLRVLKNHDGELDTPAKEAMVTFKAERQELAGATGYAVLGASKAVAVLIEASALVVAKARGEWNDRTPKDVIAAKDEDEDEDGKAETKQPEAEPGPVAPSKTTAARAAQVLRENFVASLVTMFVHQYVRTFRPMMTTAVGGSVLLLLLIASYAFEPRHLIMGFLWLLILSAAASCAYVFIGLDKDEVLSRIAKSTPGRVTFDRAFVFRTLTWAALPVLSIVAVQYPAVADTLLAWVRPLLRGLQH